MNLVSPSQSDKLAHLDHAPDKRSQAYLLLFVILILGCAVVRLAFLQHFPRQIHNDESATGMAIAAFMAPQGAWALKGSSFGGHPNFGFWLSSIPSQLTGVITLWNIRVAGAIIGLLSLLTFSLAVRDSMGRGISLMFLLLSLPFHLHVHYSRTAFQYNHALLAAGVFFWAAVRLFKCPSRLNAALVGASIGVCLLVYPAAHVLPLALLGILCTLFMFPPRNHRLASCAFPRISLGWLYAIGGFVLVFGLQLHEWIAGGYQSRASSHFILSPGSRRHLEAASGHPLTSLEIIVNSFWSTLKFFYLEDSGGQYSFRGAPLDMLGAILASVGLIVLLYRALARDFMALMIIISSCLTIAGSSLMLGSNFSPHLVLFALFIPLSCAVGLDLLVRPVARRRIYLGAFIVVSIGCWWAWWNYNYYILNMARNSKGRHVWVLNLPVDTFSVRSINNFTSAAEPFGESFYHLVYPKSKRAFTPVASAAEGYAIFTANRAAGLCPCLLLVDDSQASEFEQNLRDAGVQFTAIAGTFYDPKLNSTAFFVP